MTTANVWNSFYFYFLHFRANMKQTAVRHMSRWPTLPSLPLPSSVFHFDYFVSLMDGNWLDRLPNNSEETDLLISKAWYVSFPGGFSFFFHRVTFYKCQYCTPRGVTVRYGTVCNITIWYGTLHYVTWHYFPFQVPFCLFFGITLHLIFRYITLLHVISKLPCLLPRHGTSR